MANLKCKCGGKIWALGNNRFECDKCSTKYIKIGEKLEIKGVDKK